MGIDISDNLSTITIALQPSEEFRSCLIDATLLWLSNRYGIPHEGHVYDDPYDENKLRDDNMQEMRTLLTKWKKKGPISVSVLVKNAAGHFIPDPSVPTFNGLDDFLCSRGMSGLVHFLLNWRYDAAISFGQCIDILDWIDRILPLVTDLYFADHIAEIRKIFAVAVENKGYVTCG